MPKAGNASTLASTREAARLFDDAVAHGLPCALISELPYDEAQPQLRDRFGDAAHHIFSVVLTGADFRTRGHKAPYSVVLNQLGMPPDEVLAVTSSPQAIAAARTARIGVQAGREPCSGSAPLIIRKRRRSTRNEARTSSPH